MYKKMLCGLALAAVASSSLALPNLGTVNYIGVSSTGTVPYAGAFEDQYSFTLGSGNSVQIGLNTFFWGDTLGDIPELSFELVGIGKIFPVASVDTESVLSASVTFSGLTVGETYSLMFAGDEAINIGPDYSLHVVANQVSEPASLSMLLGALGLMGAMAQRRKTGGRA